MKLIIDKEEIEVVITKKFRQKNTYLRIKNDLKLYLTTNSFTSEKEIKRIIKDNLDSITKMYHKQTQKVASRKEITYLGKKYDLVYTNANEVIVGENKIFLPKGTDFNKWLRKQAEVIFSERVEYWYHNFSRKIPFPHLTIRKMSTRWGVCNSKLKRITLNLELIRKDIECLDYVVVHELAHFIQMDHSPKFWAIVEENFKDYKKIRRIMKDY